MVKVGTIAQAKCHLTCRTGRCQKGEPLQVIRIRKDGTYDFINIRNQLLFKVPEKMVEFL